MRGERYMKKSQYSEKLKDPRWQKKRLEIFERDDFCCQSCFDSESPLSVHHRYYEKSLDPWEYPMEALVTLCEECHQLEFESQYEINKKLIRAIRAAGFLSPDIEHIIKGLELFKLPHAPDVTASMFEWVLLNHALLKQLIEGYFEHLKYIKNSKKDKE